MALLRHPPKAPQYRAVRQEGPQGYGGISCAGEVKRCQTMRRGARVACQGEPMAKCCMAGDRVNTARMYRRRRLVYAHCKPLAAPARSPPEPAPATVVPYGTWRPPLPIDIHTTNDDTALVWTCPISNVYGSALPAPFRLRPPPQGRSHEDFVVRLVDVMGRTAGQGQGGALDPGQAPGLGPGSSANDDDALLARRRQALVHQLAVAPGEVLGFDVRVGGDGQGRVGGGKSGSVKGGRGDCEVEGRLVGAAR